VKVAALKWRHAVTEKTRKADEELREKLKHVDLEKLKKAIKPLLSTAKKTCKGGQKR
jgi:hypothetical protein